MVELDALTQLRGLNTTQAAAFVGEHPETLLRAARKNAALRGGEAVPLEITVRGENPGKD